MKHMIKLLLPILLVSLAVGVIIYRGQEVAEGISVTDGAGGDQYGAEGDQYGAVGGRYSVPADIYYTKAVASVVFSHEAHAVTEGISCNTCHGGLFKMQAKNVESQPDFNMEGLAQGKYCGSCHSSANDAVFSSDTQCARCHRGVKGVEREGEAGGSQE